MWSNKLFRKKPDAEVHFRWGLLLIECLKAILPLLPAEVEAVDYEVIPNFDGRADDLFVWFICSTKEAKGLFNRDLRALALTLLHEEMARRGFPQNAVDTLKLDVTSKPDIEEGGGRFYFFR
jgi:hypothetical protein